MDDNTNLNSPDGRVALERAALLHDVGRCEGAIQELLRYLASNPDDSEAHTLLALCYNRTEDGAKIAAEGGQSEAIRFALEGIRLAPDRAFAHYALAVASKSQGNVQSTEVAALEAIQIDPENADYHAFLSQFYVDTERYSEALEWADIGLAFEPEDDDCLSTKAMALMYLDRSDEASAAAKRALEIDPENSDSHAVMGWIALRSGQPLLATEHFRTAIQINPNFPWALDGYNRAVRASSLLLRAVSVIGTLLLRLPEPLIGLTPVAGWIAAQAMPRVVAAHPQLTHSVVFMLTTYFLLNLMIRSALSILDLLVPLRRSDPLAAHGRFGKPSLMSTGYFLSLAFLPISLAWPVTQVLLFLSDVLLMWAIATKGTGQTRKMDAGPMGATCILMLIVIWLHG